MSQVNVNEVTFGIEIECSIPVTALQAAGWRIGTYHHGIQIPTLPTGWKAEADNSIETPDYSYAKVEVVSPKLKGAEGLAQVREVCRQLNEMGAKVNRSCGLHVHVGCPENLRVIRKLVNLVSNHEKALFAITGSKSREERMYCAPVKNKLARAKDCTDNQLKVVALSEGRYCSLNLTNILAGSRPAVEFRTFAGTTNALKVVSYIQVCVGLVVKAQTSKVTVPWDAKESNAVRHQSKGPGRMALHRLFRALGWIYTIDQPERFGLIEESNKETMMNELARLAVKYDSQV